ncbi:MAG TPA: hypothetical protein VI756_19115, partial [Blastocatellia bacterium]
MTSTTRLITTLSALLVLALGVAVLAPGSTAAQTSGSQTVTTAAKPGQTTGQAITITAPPGGDNLFFVSSEVGFDSGQVKGAPYSAQGTMTFTQTLNDGTTISTQTNYNVYRDSEGRTRREETVTGAGGMAGHQFVVINDPVAGANYVLNEDDHTAVKLPTVQISKDDLGPVTTQAGGQSGSGKTQFFVMRSSGQGSGVNMPPPPPPPPPGGGFATTMVMTNGQGSTESLGTQSFNGVQAEGTRTTWTIPVGAIGNDRPIQTVSERWYSSDLQIVVMSKRTDPRVGDTVYQLANINRAEPAASLFQVPSDYTIKADDVSSTIRRAVKI